MSVSAETLRKRRYRERIAEARAMGLEPGTMSQDVSQRVSRAVPGPAKGKRQRKERATEAVTDGKILQGLEQLAGSRAVTGQARVSAARTVLEARGVLGRHATGRQDKDASTAPGLLTREGLEKELARLRRSIMPRSDSLTS